MDYSIQFSASPKAIFDAYLSKAKTLDESVEAVEDVGNLDEGDQRLLEALRNTDSLLDSHVKLHVVYFVLREALPPFPSWSCVELNPWALNRSHYLAGKFCTAMWWEGRRRPIQGTVIRQFNGDLP